MKLNCQTGLWCNSFEVDCQSIALIVRVKPAKGSSLQEVCLSNDTFPNCFDFCRLSRSFFFSIIFISFHFLHHAGLKKSCCKPQWHLLPEVTKITDLFALYDHWICSVNNIGIKLHRELFLLLNEYFNLYTVFLIFIGFSLFMFCSLSLSFLIFFILFVQVTWIRHRDLHLLTVDKTTYTSDQRFVSVNNPQIGDWSLQVRIYKLNYCSATKNTKKKRIWYFCGAEGGGEMIKRRKKGKKWNEKGNPKTNKKKRRTRWNDIVIMSRETFCYHNNVFLETFLSVWRAEKFFF